MLGKADVLIVLSESWKTYFMGIGVPEEKIVIDCGETELDFDTFYGNRTAEDMKERGTLKGNAVVGTILTNMGFHKYCRDREMTFVAAKVGDRYVLEQMLKNGYNLGGEQSGHVIFLDYCTTGDGQLTAVQICGLLKRSGRKFSEFTDLVKPYPQTMINIKVTPEAEKEFGATGRVIVRESGTEPLIRVMTEGENEEQVLRLADELAEVV